MNNINKELKKYYSQIRKNLLCPFYCKHNFIKHIKNNIDDYILENNVTCFDKIIEYFGTPDEIARSFSEIDTNHLIHKSRIQFGIIIVLIIIILLISVITYEVYMDAGGIIFQTRN